MPNHSNEAQVLSEKMTDHAGRLHNTKSGVLLREGAAKITALAEQIRALQEENKALQDALEQAKGITKVVAYDYDGELETFLRSGEPAKVIIIKGRRRGIPSAQGFRGAVRRSGAPVEVYQKQITDGKIAIHLTRTDM